jgi:CheY-like chemotaxis protein
MKLSKAGYEVETASNGQDGLEAIQRELPVLVITDCQMPRMGGLELIRKLREQPETANLPVILLTAKGYEPTFPRWNLNRPHRQAVDLMISPGGVSFHVLVPFLPVSTHFWCSESPQNKSGNVPSPRLLSITSIL